VKLALISDIHSNLEALSQAFETIDARSPDAVYCLGDIVGYGADPAACVDLVRSRCAGAVLGNHDEAVALQRGLDYLPPDGRKAAEHNRAHLAEDQRAYLAGLPLTLEVAGCTLAHAAPQDPERWYRIDSYLRAQEQFKHFATDVCFIGHTHVPAVMSNRLGVLKVRPGHRYLINVGSVGQPRDNNPHLCVTFFDTDSFAYELVRVAYNVEAAAAKIIEAGLPDRLAKRLHVGR
jgi:diadenosine tetraphosphatase ApaH/serine/threonine PP2A family protein phosphatase